MTSTSQKQGESSIPVYGLALATIADAYASVVRIFGDDGTLWEDLLRSAGLSPSDSGRPALERIIAEMHKHSDPALALCAKSLEVRLSAFDHLSAARSAMKGSQ
jgi:hypothetical protein